MKADTVIRLGGMGKRYRIGTKQDSHRTLRDTLMNALTSLLNRLQKKIRGQSNGGSENSAIWALKDVSFEIKRGEIVGIIGCNGAGKSTLLKILSRITEPTEGWGEIRGRASSLLEVGTGFHPELTGRENIYLNGAILGMRRTELERKFDDIVGFAEVEKFIDTPVKYYSSGMYLRLAFAVAAHLEPDILIVDEVLAVGDANFQKKCLTAMEDVSHRGRTVLFVSHNMPAITRLCSRAILLEQGRVVADGPSHTVVGQYLSRSLGTTAVRDWKDPESAPGGDSARLRSIRVRSHDGRITNSIDIRRPFFIEMEYDVLQSGFEMFSSYDIYNEEGIHAVLAIERGSALESSPRAAGRYLSRMTIPGNFLAEGTFFVHCFVTKRRPFKHLVAAPEAVAFQVIDSRDGDSMRGDLEVHLDGVVRPLFDWDTHLVSDEIQRKIPRNKKTGSPAGAESAPDAAQRSGRK